ncbi:hypothetical protein [Reyranella sp.]|uniref:hypothetical protein n=1 Tax=Reyranella sp. TaxID=1929291 RepID=UPI002F9596FE
MSQSNPDARGPRASRAVKLVLMGVAGAALLYSCTPGIGTAVGGWPGFWFWGNPFYRGATFSAPRTTAPGAAAPGQATTSQRGGFGGSAAAHGSSAS